MTYKFQLTKEQEEIQDAYELMEAREKEKKLRADWQKCFGWDQEGIYV